MAAWSPEVDLLPASDRDDRPAAPLDLRVRSLVPSLPHEEIGSQPSYNVLQSDCRSLLLLYIARCIPAKYTGFPGIIPRFSVSSRYPGISAKYTGLSRVSASPPGIPELVLSMVAEKCNADVGPQSGRRRSDIWPTSLRHRSDVALTSLRIAPLSLYRTAHNVYTRA